jgi:hypothetical protein
VLSGAIGAADEGSEDAGGGGGWSRREVHRATGTILAQLHVSPADALLVLRGHAFASGRTVLEVAASVVDRTIDSSATD